MMCPDQGTSAGRPTHVGPDPDSSTHDGAKQLDAL